MTVQASDFLPVLPFQVPRVDIKTGKPTKPQLDWEQAWRGAQVKANLGLQSQINTVTGDFGDLSGTVSHLTEVVGDAGSGLVQAVDGVSGEVSAARQGQLSLAANFQDVRYLALDLTNGTSLASQIGSLSTTVGGHTSTLTTLGTSVDGILAEYRVVLTLDGITGGYKVVGVQKADGTGPVFTFVIDANTEIHGDLLVTGSVDFLQLAVGGASNQAANSGSVSSGGSLSVTMTTRAGTRLIVQFTTSGGTAFGMPITSGHSPIIYSYNATVDGSAIGNSVGYAQVYDVVYNGGSSYSFSGVPTPIAGTFLVTGLSAGSHTFAVNNPTSTTINMTLTVSEFR